MCTNYTNVTEKKNVKGTYALDKSNWQAETHPGFIFLTINV